LSPSVSPSTSPSPSPGWQDYTKGNYALLPSDDTDLENFYTAQELLDVATDNSVYAEQAATDEIAIHQFKDYVGTETKCILRWNGKTTVSPTQYPVYLSIYNRVTLVWDIVASNNTANADTDFTLQADIANLTNYKDGGNVISCRVYQDVI